MNIPFVEKKVKLETDNVNEEIYTHSEILNTNKETTKIFEDLSTTEDKQTETVLIYNTNQDIILEDWDDVIKIKDKDTVEAPTETTDDKAVNKIKQFYQPEYENMDKIENDKQLEFVRLVKVVELCLFLLLAIILFSLICMLCICLI